MLSSGAVNANYNSTESPDTTDTACVIYIESYHEVVMCDCVKSFEGTSNHIWYDRYNNIPDIRIYQNSSNWQASLKEYFQIIKILWAAQII